MSNFDTAWRDVAASVLQEHPDIGERFRFSDRVHTGLASARLSRLGANLAAAGVAAACEARGHATGYSIGYMIGHSHGHGAGARDTGVR